MGIIGNYSRYLAAPGWVFGNSVVSQYQGNFSDVGLRMNRFCHFSKLSSQPIGYLAPYAWQLPIVGGNMASTNNAREAISTAGNLAGGRNLEGASSIFITITNAQLDRLIDLIASAVLQLTANNPELVAAANLLASATLQVTSNADIGAIVTTLGFGNMSIIANCFLTAIANMDAQAGGFPPLSAEGLASAVWDRLSAESNKPNTMGEAVNNMAGSSFTVEDIRIELEENSSLLNVAKFMGLK